MKEFDYEKAKAGAPVCTRDGRPAKIIYWDAAGDDPIVALVNIGEHFQDALMYQKNGRFYSGEENKEDLMMVGRTREGWVNVQLNTNDGYRCTAVCADENTAKSLADEFTVATIKIEWEE